MLWPLLFALVSVPTCAIAAQPDTAERAIELDQTIQSLKDEVIALTAEAQAVESAALSPAERRVTVYLSVAVRGLLLDTVTVTIDDRNPEVYHYDDQDARAVLAQNALQRIFSTTAGPGPHRIKLAYSGHYADDKADAPAQTDQYEAIFDKGYDQTELEFTVTPGSRFGGGPHMGLKQWRAAK